MTRLKCKIPIQRKNIAKLSLFYKDINAAKLIGLAHRILAKEGFICAFF